MSPSLLLINPAEIDRGRRVPHEAMVSVEPLALAYVAALTPAHWEVRIVDEVLEDIPDDEDLTGLERPVRSRGRSDGLPDLVGLTSLTVTAARAYDIAQRYRRRGVPVVMGGVHATLLPAEAGRYVDVVVQGDAEGAWPSLIDDFEAGRLKPRYVGRAATLAGLPRPRRDAYRRRYFLRLVSGSRGCRYRCEFCCLWKLEGGRYRTRPPGEVVDELEGSSAQRPFLFTDENVFTDRRWALALFRGMVERGVRRRYCVQASMDVADDEELLAALERSGCVMVCIGFESVSEASLQQMRKGVNLKIGVAHYQDKIARLHDHGIAVSGTFIFGGDGDDAGIFERTARFALEAGIDMAHFGILTPYPGTDLYDRLARQGRLLYTDFPADYARYDPLTAVFRPLKMAPEQLEAGLHWTAEALGSRWMAMRRAWGTWRAVQDPIVAALAFRWNRSALFRRIVKDKIARRG
jgi:radical SAM superfamily enzyme YgiQ (UPF0313 family)